ncbi:glycosyltransferase family 4 protein [Idiomarina sp.]|uniref:glycosyltransferase family 4 protein n=1 Tax=Idiomarina sp. TaxID=1874361 RepID=UPI003A934BBF
MNLNQGKCSRKMKVIFTTIGYYPEFGGVENSLKYLSKETNNLGFRPIVVAAQSEKIEYKRVTRIDGIPVVRFRFRPFKSKVLNFFFLPFSFLDILFIFRKINQKKSVRLSINRNQFTSFFATLVFKRNVYLAPGFARFQATPSMLNEKASGVKKTLFHIKAIIHNWFDKLALLRSDKVFLFSENMKRQARSVLLPHEYRSSNFQITKPGVDLDNFFPVNESVKKTLRKSLNLPEDRILILSVGRFVSAKGFSYLAASAEYLPDNASIVIVGDGPQRGDLLEVHKGLIEKKILILPGKSVDTSKYYQASDVFVLSSVYEPLGQTLLEAAACGLPIISFRNSSESGVVNATYEIFESNAFYSIEKSSSGLAMAINNYLDLEKEAKISISESTRSIVEKKCSWRTLAKELLDV